MAKESLDVAKSHLNWMNFKGRHYYQDIDDNPFVFNFVKPICSIKELLKEVENSFSTINYQ